MNQSEYLIVHLIFIVLVYHINKIEKTHKQLDVPKIEDKKISQKKDVSKKDDDKNNPKKKVVKKVTKKAGSDKVETKSKKK